MASKQHIALITGVTGQDGSYLADIGATGVIRLLEAVRLLRLSETCRIYQLLTSELYANMAKVASEDAAAKVRTNLVEYLEKGIVK